MILQKIALGILRVSGWTTTGVVPKFNKAVFVAASHTSNWDGWWLIVFKLALNIKLRFLAKPTLFWWPLGPLLRWLGAIPVDRSRGDSTVQQLVAAFAQEEHLLLALAPEGTRRWMPYWKTGFYQIAKAAQVPIVLTYIDYPRMQMGIGITLQPSGDIDKDLSIIREFYEPFVPRHPALRGPVAFPPTADNPVTRNDAR